MKLFLDLGPGKLNSEAWDDKWKDHFIVGLEPDKRRFQELREEYPGLLLRVAAWDSNDSISGSSSKFGFIESRGNEEVISSITLDRLYEMLGNFEEVAIWMDIEGSELKALKGAKQVLKNTRWLNIEVRVKTSPGWATAKEIYRFLEQRDFRPEIKLEKLSKNRHQDVKFKNEEYHNFGYKTRNN